MSVDTFSRRTTFAYIYLQKTFVKYARNSEKRKNKKKLRSP